MVAVDVRRALIGLAEKGGRRARRSGRQHGSARVLLTKWHGHLGIWAFGVFYLVASVLTWAIYVRRGLKRAPGARLIAGDHRTRGRLHVWRHARSHRGGYRQWAIRQQLPGNATETCRLKRR